MGQVAVPTGRQLSFYNRRLHSLLGVIPVGAFLLNHLWTNFTATKGLEAFLSQVEWLHSLPFLLALEIFFIFLPILYHGVYGLYIAFQAKNNIDRYGTLRNLAFFWQRVTGVITLLFIIWHLWETRIQLAIHDWQAIDLARVMTEILSNRFYFFLYVIAIVAAVFHFSNGMWSFLVSWGITVGPRAQQASTVVWLAVFLLVSYVGIESLFAFVEPNFLQPVTE